MLRAQKNKYIGIFFHNVTVEREPRRPEQLYLQRVYEGQKAFHSFLTSNSFFQLYECNISVVPFQLLFHCACIYSYFLFAVTLENRASLGGGARSAHPLARLVIHLLIKMPWVLVPVV